MGIRNKRGTRNVQLYTHVHLGIECNEYMKNLDIVKEAASEARRTFFAILNSGLCEMELHPFPLSMRKIYQTFVLPRALYSWSKGALSVNFSSIAIELNVPRDDFSSIELLSPWDTVLKKPVQSSLIFVRLEQGLFKVQLTKIHIPVSSVQL